MEKRIYRNIAIISIIITFIITLILSFNFYNFFLNREKTALKNHGEFIYKNMDVKDLKKIEDLDKYRISLIDSSGRVSFDSQEDIAKMESHSDRPEVIQALKNGRSEVKRYSSTLSRDSYYYSILLDNGDILRLSMDFDSLISIFIRILPLSITLIIISLGFLLYISSRSTKKIVEPINILADGLSNIIQNNSNMDQDMEVYEELLPFVETISYQSKEINNKIKELKEKNNLISNMISNMNEGLIFLDRENKIIMLNSSSVDLLGKNEAREVYEGQDFINLSRNIELGEKILEVKKEKKEGAIDLNLESRILEIHISPVLENNENIEGVLIFIQDKTSERKAENLRREFSANISHELKGPLTSINGYAELIKEGMIPYEDTKEIGQVINNEGNRLLDLIDDIMRLSQLDEAKIKEDFEDLNLDKLVHKNLNKLVEIYPNRKIDYDISENLGNICGNKNMVEELIYNILENSIKHSDCNKLSVRSSKGENSLSLVVKDNGIGISKLDQDRIFERFYIVDSSRRKASGNTGLGLSIAKHIMEYHSGSIDLISNLNRGTNVIMTFPD